MERANDVLADFIATLTDGRPHRHVERPWPRAESLRHESSGGTRDSRQCTPPTRMNSGHRSVVLVPKHERNTVCGMNDEAEPFRRRSQPVANRNGGRRVVERLDFGAVHLTHVSHSVEPQGLGKVCAISVALVASPKRLRPVAIPPSSAEPVQHTVVGKGFTNHDIDRP